MAERFIWRGSRVDPQHADVVIQESMTWRGSPVEESRVRVDQQSPLLWRGSMVQEPVWIDDDGLLHRGERWVALPDLEWRIVGLLVERFGDLVSRRDLAAAGWGPDADTGPRLTHRVARARKRLVPLDLRISGIAGRGYYMTPDR